MIFVKSALAGYWDCLDVLFSVIKKKNLKKHLSGTCMARIIRVRGWTK